MKVVFFLSNALSDVLSYINDVDELVNIINRISSDKDTLSGIAAKLIERKNHLQNMKVKTLEISDLMNRAINERNQ